MPLWAFFLSYYLLNKGVLIMVVDFTKKEGLLNEDYLKARNASFNKLIYPKYTDKDFYL